jgi:hypothetical protein
MYKISVEKRREKKRRVKKDAECVEGCENEKNAKEKWVVV